MQSIHGRGLDTLNHCLCFLLNWLFSFGVMIQGALCREGLAPVAWSPPAVALATFQVSGTGTNAVGGAIVSGWSFFVRRRLWREREKFVAYEMDSEVREALRLLYEELEAKLDSCLHARGGPIEALTWEARKWAGCTMRADEIESLRFRVLDFYALYHHIQNLSCSNYRSLWRHIQRLMVREQGSDKSITPKSMVRAVLVYEIQTSEASEGTWEFCTADAYDRVAKYFFGSSYHQLEEFSKEKVEYYVWTLQKHWCEYALESRMGVAVP